MTDINEAEFVKRYVDPVPERLVAYIDLDEWDREAHEDCTPFIEVHYGGRTVFLNPMGLTDHLCIDAHAFIDGEQARVAAFGLDEGARAQFPPEDTKGKSHGWPATNLVALLIGEQT